MLPGIKIGNLFKAFLMTQSIYYETLAASVRTEKASQNCYMPKMRAYLVLWCMFMLSTACQRASSPEQAGTPNPEEHAAGVEAWHEQRIVSLMDDRGWLKLAGLYWLDNGVHSFGSAAENDIVMPQEAIPGFAGDITRQGNMITVDPAEDEMLLVNNEALIGSITFPVQNSLEFTHGRLAFQFIERGDLIGLRLYDEESALSRNFEGINRFPVSLEYKVEARLVPHDPPRKLPIVNMIGQTDMRETPGTLEFELGGVSHELTPLSASDGERLFIIIADQTNGESTFGGGRFLYADNPGPGETVILDFNKVYNPPCAFSEYTTCPLPPPENRLSVALESGEKRYN